MLNADYPKISMFEHSGVVYDSVGHPSFSDYRTEVKFENFPSSSLVNPKVNWCINAISCIGGVPLHFSSTILPRSAVTNESGAISMSTEWFYEDNISLMIKDGETFSMVSALGSCANYTNGSLRTVMKITQRLIDNISCESNSITFDNIIAHHTSEIVKHRMRNGNLIFPILPGDLESHIFDNCPYNVIKDHIRCWNSIDEKVVGVGVTTPLFSDSVVDYHPLNWGPKFLLVGVSVFLLCDQPTYLHTRLGDCYNKHDSGFLYLPESFRMSTNHLQTIDSTTWTTCTDHINMLQRIQQRGLYCTAEAYIHSKCLLTNDELSSMAAHDENRQKVPRSNCLLRHAVLSTTVF